MEKRDILLIHVKQKPTKNNLDLKFRSKVFDKHCLEQCSETIQNNVQKIEALTNNFLKTKENNNDQTNTVASVQNKVSIQHAYVKIENHITSARYLKYCLRYRFALQRNF